MQIMTPNHQRWAEFRNEVGRLVAENGCTSTTDRPQAQAVLAEMGFSEADIRASLEYFSRGGGFCDCEILYNVAAAEQEMV